MKIYAISDILGYLDEFCANEEYDEERDKKSLDFISHLELHYKYKDEVVFCHAGVNEEET